MQYKLPDIIEKNSHSPEDKSALNSNKNQIETIKNHTLSVPFETEPSEFSKVLSDWQSKKKQSEENESR